MTTIRQDDNQANIQLVLFDMDGVLFEGSNFWLDLHHAFGTQEEGVRLFEEFGRDQYNLLAKIVAGRLWNGKPADVYYKLVGQRKFHPGVHELFEFLNQRGLKTAVVSSGPYELAFRAQRELEINEIRANLLQIRNGHLTGKVDVMVDDGDKSKVGLDLIQLLGATPEQTAFIGDAANDVTLAKCVGLPIAYNSTSDLLNHVCRFHLPYGKLKSAIEILDNQGKIETEIV